ncbi:hypothetical protein M4A92_12240 [Caldibacillus thermoamylovorans]|uniref:hypothetical protein n=1 Tax=Caldibacillus thermoamylovorans TaxID=35841 RepID=UPI0020412A2A|nr:hypothetical protein [Caldibacillus thermoamylovorans]MCM3799382.1 hypothetical protein [Caldibacillus thermoamylovorans]
MAIFSDDTCSRHHFESRNSTFWRRDHFSSSFLDGKHYILATRPLLVVVLRRKTLYFGDETLSRRPFKPKNRIFWRRDHFSSSFCAGKPHFLATRPLLVVVLSRKTAFFGDETTSRRRFEARKLLFWRRDPFSSLIFGKTLPIL